MLSGRVSYSGYTETQTYSRSGGGTCSAAYRFSLDSSRPLFGDLGGFSRTNGGVYGLTVVGAVTTTGSITQQSGCEPQPDPEFGLPPRGGTAFSVNAHFDPSTGIISVNSVETEPFHEGTRTDRVTGQLSGGLQIYDESARGAQNVTGLTNTVAVGQEMKLVARLADGAELTSPKWTGITPLSGLVTPSGVASPDAIKSYLFEDALGSVTNLTTADMESPQVTFYWIHSYTYTVQVSGRDTTTGQLETAAAVFDVQAPTNVSFTAATCHVYTGPRGGGVAQTTGYLVELWQQRSLPR